MNGIVAWFARNSVAANLLMFIFFAGGVFGYSSMEREMFPVVKVSGASVSVAWTGASPPQPRRCRRRPAGVGFGAAGALAGLASASPLTSL